MALPEAYTYGDAIDALTDLATPYGRSAPQPTIRRAIRMARDEIAASFGWSFLQENGRVLLRAAQTDGTVAYDHTGGATCERQVTLTHATATWPTWAISAAIRIGTTVCDVQEVKTDTVLQLDSVMNPGQDIAAGTTYSLYPRWYRLPADFAGMVRTYEETAWRLGREIPFEEMIARQKYLTSSGDINLYAIGPTQDEIGTQAIYVAPPSDTTEPIDFLYRRRLRDLRYTGHDAPNFAGTVAVTADSYTVTGSGTSFQTGMVNSIFRVSSSTTIPTGLEGLNPWVEQRVIRSVESTTSLTLDNVIATSRSGVKYVVSDPIDVAPGAWNAFVACAAKNYAIAVNLKEKGELIALWKEALRVARQADCRTLGPSVMHIGPVIAGRMADSQDREVVE